jgi:hypothetical protein
MSTLMLSKTEIIITSLIAFARQINWLCTISGYKLKHHMQIELVLLQSRQIPMNEFIILFEKPTYKSKSLTTLS